MRLQTEAAAERKQQPVDGADLPDIADADVGLLIRIVRRGSRDFEPDRIGRRNRVGRRKTALPIAGAARVAIEVEAAAAEHRDLADRLLSPQRQKERAMSGRDAGGTACERHLRIERDLRRGARFLNETHLESGLKIVEAFGVRSLRRGLDRAPDVNRKLDVRHQAVIDLEKRQLRVRYEVIAVRRRAEVGLIVAVCGRSGIVGIERRPGDRALRREQDGKDEHDGSGAHHAVHLSTAF